MKKLLTFIFFLVMQCLGINAANANLLTFDDITADAEAVIDNSYGNLNWSNFWIQDPVSNGVPDLESGFYNGVVSGYYSAFNAGGNDAEITSSTPFDFTSAYFAAAYRWGLEITATGFLNGSQVGNSQQFIVNTDAASFIELNFTGIDRLTFSASGGEEFVGTGYHFTIDNANVSAVPVPAAAWLFGSALAGFIGLKRRKV